MVDWRRLLFSEALSWLIPLRWNLLLLRRLLRIFILRWWTLMLLLLVLQILIILLLLTSCRLCLSCLVCSKFLQVELHGHPWLDDLPLLHVLSLSRLVPLD